MKLRAVAYCRVSSDTEDLKNSLENQRAFFIEEINKSNWIEDGLILQTDCGDNGIYADEGISGTGTEKRLEFLRMIRDAKSGKFDYILTKQVSRFARNVEDLIKTIRELKRLEVGVYFVSEKLNSLDTSTDFFLTMFAGMAQQESILMSERIKFGLKRAVKDGIRIGQAPYGYKKENKRLVIEQYEANVIRDIYDKFLSGWGVGKIARYLNSNNTPTRNNTMWYQLTVSQKLKNPLYNGVIVSNKEETIDPIAKIIKKLPQEKWTIIEDKSLKIIEDDIFQKTQNELLNRSSMYGKKIVDKSGMVTIEGRTGRSSSTHLFSNLLYCSHCGSAMKRKKVHSYKRKDGTSNEEFEWTCVKRDMYGLKGCNSVVRTSIKEELAIKMVKKEIEEWKSETLSDLHLGCFEDYKQLKLGDELVKQLPEIKMEIEKVKKEIKTIVELLSCGDMDRDIFDELNGQKRLALHELSIRKKIIENLDEQRKETDRKKHEYKELIKSIQIADLSNSILKQLFTKINVTRVSGLGTFLDYQYKFNLDWSEEEYSELIRQDTQQKFKEFLKLSEEEKMEEFYRLAIEASN